MKIYPIQTGSVAVKKRQRDGSRGSGFVRLLNTLADKEWTNPLPIYAWVIEHPEGIIVIDTGETGKTGSPGYFPWWQPYFRFGVRFDVDPNDEIGPQLRRRGINASDVRWVILTHLHTDHAGGLYHFPESEILVSRKEFEIASGLAGRMNGYLPNRWPNWFNPTRVDYQTRDDAFISAYTLTKSGDVRIVPTPGHTPGHQSVILDVAGKKFVFAGDASYTMDNLIQSVIDGVTLNVAAANETLNRLSEYVNLNQSVYLPSHDPEAEERLRNALPAQSKE